MEKPNKAAIDGDLIAYKAAASAEESYIIVTHKSSGNIKRFSTRTDFWGHHTKKAGGWLASLNKEREEEGKKPFPLDAFVIEDGKDVQPASYACQIAKQMLTGVKKGSGCEDIEVYLSGKENFRDSVATIYGYKNDRVDKEKPEHIDAVKTYLVNQFGATYTEGYEADDKLAMLAHTGEAIQCSIDKDNYQVKGWLYDWDKMEEPFEVKTTLGKLWVSKTDSGKEKIRGTGFKHLCFQMLIGDSVDCIKPKYLAPKVKYGEKSAYRDLHPVKTEKLCLIKVLDKYKEWYPEPVTYNHWKTGEELTKNYFEIASEMFTLLYMWREVNDETTLESVCNRLGVKYE